MDQKYDTCSAEEIIEEQRFLYSKLLGNLEKEQSIQQSLLDLLEEERVVLTKASPDAIEEINSRKESLLLREKSNTLARRDIIEQIRSLLGFQAENISLSDLVDRACDEALTGKLRIRQQLLTQTANTIRVNNHRNRELIHAALEDVQGSLRLLQNMVAPGGNYQKTGQLSMNAMQGSLIHREG